MNRNILAVGLLALTFSLAACGGDTATDSISDPAAGACLEGTPDCDDIPGEVEPVGHDFDSEAAIAEAEGLLGLTLEELEPEVRIARQGEEHMMLTEDYRVGRMTVEVDINDMDEWIVTSVTVELPDAPRTFTRHLS